VYVRNLSFNNIRITLVTDKGSLSKSVSLEVLYTRVRLILRSPLTADTGRFVWFTNRNSVAIWNQHFSHLLHFPFTGKFCTFIS
jgi:hypothetical protein